MDLDEIKAKILEFRDAREWAKFHTAKDMAYGLMLESAELAEHFQWMNEPQALERIETHRQELGDELADVLYWVVLMAHEFGIDLGAAFSRKMERNEEKYPIEKCKGKNKKYDALGN